MAAFKERTGADTLKRKLRTESRVISKLFLCEKCDYYHVRVDTGYSPFQRSFLATHSDKVMRLVNMIANGYTCERAAQELGMSYRTTDNVMEQLRARFYALNTPHLIAILIALGVIEPLTFVKGITENHA
jgi:DNA-binding CsgD family transcriptional regulator